MTQGGIMTENMPTGFNDLKPTELFRSALEDFALPVDEADKNKKKVLLAAFAEGGVSWDDYVSQHPEVAPAPEPTPQVQPVAEELTVQRETEPSRGNVVSSTDVTGAEAPVSPVEEVVIRTAQPPMPQVNEKFLIKMVRDNPRFEVKGHNFTSSHPYALVNEDVANHLLEKEDGFRMATPSELREFYG